MAPSVISLVVTTKHIYIYLFTILYISIIYIYHSFGTHNYPSSQIPIFHRLFFHVGIPCWSGRSSIEATEGEAPGNGGRHFRGQGRQGGVELKLLKWIELDPR